MNSSSSSFQDDKDNYSVIQRKSLAITLGNAKDVGSLLDMLETDKHPEVLIQVIRVLGALGMKEAIAPLKTMMENMTDPTVLKQAKEAIEVIYTISQYR